MCLAYEAPKVTLPVPETLAREGPTRPRPGEGGQMSMVVSV